MASGLEQDLRELQILISRAQQAGDKIDTLHRQLEESRRREEDLRVQLDQTHALLKQAQTDMQFLRISHRLASSPDSIIEARRMISGLIRNIDKALAEIKE